MAKRSRAGWQSLLGSLACTAGLACGGLAVTSRAATLDYSLADPALAAPGGWLFPGSPEGSARIAALMDVKLYVESVLPNPGSLTIELSVFSDPGVATLASGGQFFSLLSPLASGVVLGDAQMELLMGAPLAGANGFLAINSAKPFYLGAAPGGIGPGMPDLRSVLLHEVGHVLGWASFMKPDDKTSALTDFLKDLDPGTYAGLGEVFSLYDTLLVDSMGFPVILPGGIANPAALPIGGASIASPLAIVANGGELVDTAVIPFIDGDMTHLAPGVLSVMNPTLASGTTERSFSSIDLAVLKDLGYVAVVPEPSAVWLWLPGLLLIGWRWRRGAAVRHVPPRC